MSDNIGLLDALSSPYSLRLREINGIKFLICLVASAPYVADGMFGITVSQADETLVAALTTAGHSIPAGATHVLMSVAAGAGNIAYTDDGSTMTGLTGGLLIPGGDQAEINCSDLTKVHLFGSAASIPVMLSFRHY